MFQARVSGFRYFLWQIHSCTSMFMSIKWNPCIALINQRLKRLNKCSFFSVRGFSLFFLRIKELLWLSAGLNDSLMMDIFCSKCRLFSASNMLYLPWHCTMQPVRLTCELCQKIQQMKESFESSSKRNQVFQAPSERGWGAAISKSDQTITFFPFLIVIRPYFLTANKIIVKVMR